MIHHHIGNLFDRFANAAYMLATEEKLCLDNMQHIIMHGCNAQGKMGSGFAKELRSRYPGAYEAYEKQHQTSGLVLGHNVYYVPEVERGHHVIVSNCITQENYGYDGKKYVSYDAIDECMIRLNDVIGKIGTNIHLHFPKLGAELGGGSWNVIQEIIDDRIVNAHKHLYTLK